MKSILPLLLLVFSLHIVVAQQAGCDYNALMKEGRSLYDKQQYRAAIKKFNAARICDGSRSAEVDREVDRVFDAIERQRDEANLQRSRAEQEQNKALEASRQAGEERQRAEQEKNNAIEASKLANAMRDSVFLANTKTSLVEQQMAIFIEANDLQGLGDYYRLEKNYDKAQEYYQKALNVLARSSQQDSVILRKQENIAQAATIITDLFVREKAFHNLISRADSAVNAGILYYPNAYEWLKEAMSLDFDSTLVVRKIDALETGLGDKFLLTNDLDRDTYFRLVDKSADINLEQGKSQIAQKRIKTALNYYPEQLDFLQNSALRTFATAAYKRKLFLHRFEVYAGVKSFFPALNDPNSVYPSIFSFMICGGTVHLKNRSYLGVELGSNFGGSKIDNINSTYTFRQADVSFYYGFEIYKKRDLKWSSDRFSLKAIGGVTAGSSAYSRPRHPIEIGTFTDSRFYEYLSSRWPGISIPGSNEFSADKIVLSIPKADFIKISYLDKTDNYLFCNGFLGLRLNWLPYSMYRIVIFGEASYYYQIWPGSGYKNVDIEKRLLDYAEQVVGFTEQEKIDLATNLDENNVPKKPKLKAYSPDLNAGICIKLGLSYRF